MVHTNPADRYHVNKTDSKTFSPAYGDKPSTDTETETTTHVTKAPKATAAPKVSTEDRLDTIEEKLTEINNRLSAVEGTSSHQTRAGA